MRSHPNVLMNLSCMTALTKLKTPTVAVVALENRLTSWGVIAMTTVTRIARKLVQTRDCCMSA